jgi:hypothetical protein
MKFKFNIDRLSGVFAFIFILVYRGETDEQKLTRIILEKKAKSLD